MKWLDDLPHKHEQPIFKGLEIHGKDGRYVLDNSEDEFFIVCADGKLLVFPATDACFKGLDLDKR